MSLPGRPRRLEGVTYDRAGPIYHCRMGTWNRVPHLAAPDLADLVLSALRHYHGLIVEVFAYCVMSDHVHVLVSLARNDTSLSRWVADLKRWTTREAKRGSKELRWQPGFFEHVLRQTEDVLQVGRYILANPVRAGLTDDWQAYRWSGSFVWTL